MARQPLKLLLTVMLFAEQGFLFVSEYLQTLLQLLLLFFAKKYDACRLRFAHFQLGSRRFVLFKHHCGDLAVDLRTGQLF